MIFNDEYKVIIATLSEPEATAFLMFLNVEESRHRVAMERSLDNIKSDNKDNEIDSALILFEESAIKRHMEDIEDIKKIRQKVKDKFGWLSLNRFN